MKRWVAGLLTVCIGMLLLLAAVFGPRERVNDTPEKCLDQMFQAMKAGDVPKYLDCFAGELRDQLESTVRTQGTAGFANYLKETAGPVKGRALFGAEYASADRAQLKVDRVYESRMWEYQNYRLDRRSGAWRIYSLDPVQLHEPPIPYGTPAFPTSDPPNTPSNGENP
jgi:hypothetical protein